MAPRSVSSHSACFRNKPDKGSPLILVVSLVSLTSVLGQQYYNAPKLAIGTPAPQTIYAPASTEIVDQLATQQQRDEVLKRLTPVFMINPHANQEILQNLNQRLSQIESLRQIAGPLPFVDPGILATDTQRYLRRTSDAEWQLILAIAEQQQSQNPSAILQNSPAARNAITQLSAYGKTRPRTEVARIVQTTAQARQQYQRARRDGAILGQLFNLEALLDLTDQDWRALQGQIQLLLSRILTQGIPAGLPRSILEDAVQLHTEALPAAQRPLAQQLITSVLQPNLVIDLSATTLQTERFVKNLEPVSLQVQRGDVIIRQGQPITPEAFLLLDHFQLSRRGINWWGLISVSALTGGAIAIYWGVRIRSHARFSRRDHLLILLLTLSAPITAWTTQLTYTSLPAVGLLVGSFYGSVLGGTVILLLSLLMPLSINANLWELWPIAVGSLVGAIVAGRSRSREELALLGGIIALVQGLTFLLIMSVTGIAWYTLLGAALWRSFMGLGWSIAALGVSPYLEHLFDLVTPIRLAELANPNRPMLKRLAQEAPGTFQHTLFVATLAEAGARTLGGNVELVRAGTLYHDIGKLHDPLGFIENQMGGPNKHDQLQDPWESAEIIKKHVSEGLVMARKCRLPTAIQAFIPEHQGTMLITYFYYQAQQQVAQTPGQSLQEADFRYAGPIPQSRETGIVMLADSCEAALRSLKDATPAEALDMINKIFKARWQDNQLVDSGLRREDLTILAEVFVQVWLQSNHQRIRYPSPMLPPRPTCPPRENVTP